MNFHVITLFPEAFKSYLGESILKRAIEDKKIKVKFYNPRDFTRDKHRRIDRKPYGGGPGMVIEAMPVIKAIEKALKSSKFKVQSSKVKVVWFTPSGKKFDTKYAKVTAKKYKNLILVSGRYEGIDARVKKIFRMDEISIGDYVVTGGELPAMVLMDSISRQVEGVLGDINSLEESRMASPDVYTRPEMFSYKGKSHQVPKILLSGNHSKIDEWKLKKIKKK